MKCERKARRALRILNGDVESEYSLSLDALCEDTREWWEDTLAQEPANPNDGNAHLTPGADGLRQFLEAEVLPWFETRKIELANRSSIREHALGEDWSGKTIAAATVSVS